MSKSNKISRFTLKSGNNPTFRQMGSSPANMKNFGVGESTSPYKQDDDDMGKANENANNNQQTTDKTTDKTNEQGGDAEREDKAWVKALKIGTTLLSGGIQGVYGGKREIPKINYGKKADKLTKSPEDNVRDLVSGKKRSGGFGALSGTTINNTNKIVNGKEESETT